MTITLGTNGFGKSMSGEKRLSHLLHSLSPVLQENHYVFCTFGQSSYGDCAKLCPIASFQEKEGLTLIIEKSVADRNALAHEGVFRCITLSVHSSLNAVGLTAAVAGMLAEHAISANVIAAYYHDHIFVPANEAEKAYHLLKSLESLEQTKV